MRGSLNAGGPAKLWENVMRGMTGYDIAANRFLLIGCTGIVALIVALLVAALR